MKIKQIKTLLMFAGIVFPLAISPVIISSCKSSDSPYITLKTNRTSLSFPSSDENSNNIATITVESSNSEVVSLFCDESENYIFNSSTKTLHYIKLVSNDKDVKITAKCNGCEDKTITIKLVAPSIEIDGPTQLNGIELTSGGNQGYSWKLNNIDRIADLIWSIDNKPSWLTLTQISNDALITWDETIQFGTHNINLKVSSLSTNLSCSKQITISVTALPTPTIIGPNTITAYESIDNINIATYSSDISSTWSLVGTVPIGVSINENFGTLSVLSNAGSGTKSFKIRCTSIQNPQKYSEKNISLQIISKPAPTEALIHGEHDLYGAINESSSSTTEGIYYATSLSPDNASNNFSYSLNNAPSGVSISTIDGEAKVTWDNSFADEEDYLFEVVVTSIVDSSEIFTQQVVLHIMEEFEEPTKMDIDCKDTTGDFNVPMTEGVLGERQYIAQVQNGTIISSTKNINQNVTWSLTGTNVPTWLSIDEWGCLYWTNEVFQCEDEDNPYDVVIKATSREKPILSYSHDLKLKITAGDKTTIFNNVKNKILLIKDKGTQLFNILKNTYDGSDANVLSVISNYAQNIVNTTNLLISSITAISDITTLTEEQVENILTLADDVNTNVQNVQEDLLDYLLGKANDNDRYKDTNEVNPVNRYLNDQKRTNTSYSLSYKAFSIAKLPLSGLIKTGFLQSTLIGCGYVCESSIECLITLTQLTSAAANLMDID